MVLTHGVHRLTPGETSSRVHLDPERLYLFDAAGALARAPSSVAAAER